MKASRKALLLRAPAKGLAALLVLCCVACTRIAGPLDDEAPIDEAEVPWSLMTGWLVIQQPSLDGSLVLFDATAKTVTVISANRLLLNPALSPDRRIIAYTRVDGSFNEGIWGIPVTGDLVLCPRLSSEPCGLLLVDETDVDERGPAWSTGGRLAYFQGMSFYVDRVRAHNEGSVQRCCQGRIPAWAPDGTLVAYLDDDTPGLYRIDPDTKEVELLFADPDENTWLGDPAVSPDGSRLAYVRFLSGRPSEIWISMLDGTDARQVATGTLPVWSPDGKVIAFDFGTAVYLVEADGGERVFVANGGQPSWQPLEP